MPLKVGVQLFSVRNAMAENPLAALEQVGKLGYKSVEFANHNARADFGCGFNVPAADLKARLDAQGMAAVSAHVSPLDQDNLNQVADYYQHLNCTNLVCSADFFADRDDVLRKAEAFSRIGEALSSRGITYLYHNHFHEFQRFGGATVLELLRDHVDPRYVGFQLDTFWAYRGGADAVEVMKSFGKAIKSIHQKDYSKTSPIPMNLFTFVDPGQNFDRPALMNVLQTPWQGRSQLEVIVEIGTGRLDIQALLDAASAHTDARYVILEQDATTLGEMESLKVSMEAFRKFRGVTWS